MTVDPRSPGGGASPPYVPVDGAPWRLSMGLHRLDPVAWLEVDANRAVELRNKAALLRDARAAVLATLPRGDAASAELLGLVLAALCEHHPGTVDVDGPRVTERSTGATIDTGRTHPIEAASLVVQEDLCVLERDEAAWRLTAACVCFPSRWRLRDKLGETLSSIHGPVPGFEDDLARPASTFFDRLTVTRPVWRLNWTLLDTPELHLPSPAARRATTTPPTGGGAPAPAALWFRVERQTLRRLAHSGAVVFTIRTYVEALDTLVRATPGAAAALRDTLRTVPPDVAAYKGWTPLLGPALDWLDAHDATADGGHARRRGDVHDAT